MNTPANEDMLRLERAKVISRNRLAFSAKASAEFTSSIHLSIISSGIK